MASNNYISANITPSSDTFREWVDLTNRITFDMSDKVVTTAKHSVGGGTTGNAYVNGIFSANTLFITDSISGAKTDDTANNLGANSTVANVVFSSNVVFIANSTANAIIHAQSNVNFTGQRFTLTTNTDLDAANVDINATKLKISGTSANIHSTTLLVNGTTFDVDSNVDIDNALTDITATDFNVSGSNVTIDSTHVDIDGTSANLDSTTTNINGTTLDINSATVDIDSATEVNVNAPDIDINGALLDINSTTVDIDGTTTDINADDVNISGANSKINSTHLDIHGTTLDINSATNIDGNVTLTANIIVGTANDDFMNVNSKAYLFDILDVAEPANLQKDLTVGGHTTLNGNTVIGDNLAVDELKLNAQVNTAILPTTNGTLSIGNTTQRWDGVFDDLVGDDITANNTLTVTGQADFNGDVNLGDAATDTVTFVADVDSNILPSANGNDLGAANARWDLLANGINASDASVFQSTIDVTGVGTFGNDVDITGEANTGTLRVRSTSKLEGFANAVQSIGVGANAHIAGNVYIHHGDSDGVTTISNGNITVGSGSANTAITPESIDTDGTLAVLGAASIANTLATGNTTVTGFANVTGNLRAASANVSGHTNAATLGATGAVDFDSTLNVDGLITGGAGLDITGIANASSEMNIGTNVGSNTKAHFVKGTATVGNAVVNSSTISIGNSLATTVIKKSTIDVGANVDINTSAFFVKGTTAMGNAVVNSSVIHIGNNDTNTHISKAGIDTDGTLAVKLATTLSNTVAAGNTTITGFADISGNMKAVSANVSGHSNVATLGASGAVALGSTLEVTGNADLNGDLDVDGTTNLDVVDIDGAVDMANTLGVTGPVTFGNTLGVANLATFNAGAVITGTANTGVLHVGPGLADRVRISNNTIKVGTTAGAFTEVTTTGITSTGAVAITNTAAFGNTTISGTGSVTGAFDAGATTLGSLTSTGAVDFDSTLNVDGKATFNGDVDLGNANTDSVNFIAEVSSNISPEGNTQALGLNDARWIVKANTINTSGGGTIGDDLSVGGTTQSTSNTTGAITSAGGLGVKKSATIGQNLKVEGDGDIDGNLTVGPAFSVSSNNVYSTMTANAASVQDLTVTGSASLPSDTTLSLNQADIVELDVSANADFGKTTSVVMNLGGDPAGRTTVNLTNAHFTNTMALDHRLEVGTFVTDESGSGGATGTGSQLTSTTLETNIVRARSDLIANYSSDRNLKNDVIKIDTALDKIETIGGYEFTWNKLIDDHRVGTKDYGVIAQELEEILPHAVDINNRGYKTVNYNSLIPLLIEAVKELSGKVKELEKGDEIDG